MSLPVPSSETTGTAVHAYAELLGSTTQGSALLGVCVISLVVVVVLAAMIVRDDPVI